MTTALRGAAHWRLWGHLGAAFAVLRNVPIAIFCLLRWRVLACSIGLGRWKQPRGFENGIRFGRRRPREVPWVTRWIPTRHGYRFTIWLRRGDTHDDLINRLDALSLGLRGKARLVPVPGKPWRVTVHVMRRDPFAKPVPAPRPLTTTSVRVGITELGAPFILDFRDNPHLLIAGTTGSGKSGALAALLSALAATDAVIVMIDPKWGIGAAPMRPRASVIAESRVEASALLADLLTLAGIRALEVKAGGVENTWQLPHPPPEIYCFVDEVAELLVGGTTEETAAAKQAMSQLVRVAQLTRALGVHLIVSGQRFGAQQGAQVTSLRAQLGGRVCFRTNDIETANMVLGDTAADAAFAAVEISAKVPGCGVSNTGSNHWEVARFAYVPHADLRPVALENATKNIEWHQLMAVPEPPVRLAHPGQLSA